MNQTSSKEITNSIFFKLQLTRKKLYLLLSFSLFGIIFSLLLFSIFPCWLVVFAWLASHISVLGVAAYLLINFSKYREADLSEEIDELLNLKDRLTTLEDPGRVKNEKVQELLLIESQIAKTLPSNWEEITSTLYKLPRAYMFAWALLVFVWAAHLALYLLIDKPTPFTSLEALEIEKLITEEPLPKDVAEALKEVAKSFESGGSVDDVITKIDAAQKEIIEAETNNAEKFHGASSKTPEQKISTPTATPTPTPAPTLTPSPTPTAPQEKGENGQSKKPSDSDSDTKEEVKEGKEGDKGEGKGSAGDKEGKNDSGQGQGKEESKSEGSGEGESKKEEAQPDSQGEKKDTAQSKEGQDKKEGGSSEGKEKDKEKNSSGLDKAKELLDKLKKEIGKEKNKNESSKEEKSDAQKEKKDEKGDSKSEGGKEGEKKSDNQKQKGLGSESHGENAPKVPNDQSTKGEERKGQGNGEGLGDKKGFKDLKIQDADEKYDPQYAQSTGEVKPGETPGGKALRELAPVELGKDVAVKDREVQRIPIPYKDLLE